MIKFEQAISELDLRLFEKITSQSTDHDKRSLLACQLAVRQLAPGYNYLEIGSYLGGSIQPHLLDPLCRRIYSIDKRPLSQPDARGYDWEYRNNSTARMINMLGEVAADTSKIKTIDGDTNLIDRSRITDKIELCFIDGEHTDASVATDFRFCLDVLAANGAIIFHDAQIIYNAISTALGYLTANNIDFRAYILAHTVFVVEIGDFPLHKSERISEILIDNHHGYLFSLKDNDHFRNFATRFPFGFLRRLILKIKGVNSSE